MSVRRALKSSTWRMTRLLLPSMLIGVLTEIDLKAIFPDLDLLWCEALLDLYPSEFGEDMRRRPGIDP